MFEGYGQFPNTRSVQLKEGTTPTIRQSWRVPYILQGENPKKMLDRLKGTGVVWKANIPTAWVNPIVIVENPASLWESEYIQYH